MAIVTDFLIGFLLLVAAAINILALSAFLITPSLRTTANRFVINLLIVNVIGCIILAPSLLFNSNAIRDLYSSESPKQISNNGLSGLTGVVTEPNNKPIYNDDNQMQMDETTTTISSRHVEENETPYHRKRPWVLDIIAAVGAFSLVLVVGDTYIGVTDPLRYHSRVSASRVCILIIIVWCSALGFGGSSAFRSTLGERQKVQPKLYNAVYRYAYFVCIIVIPFSLVCVMYWGIIREARKNGLRLRHNGSSPLLQSVLHIGPQYQNKRDGIQEISALPDLSTNNLSINAYKQRNSLGIHRGLRRDTNAQYSTYPTCECCYQYFITRSISNQSAYFNNARVPNRDLRMVRSSPDLHQNLLAEQGVVLCLPQRSTKPLSYISSLRHRLSNASSLFKYREESRAARISILVVIMFVISYIPFGLLVLTEGHNFFLSTYQQTVLAIFFVVLANIISPLIFAYRNKRVRRGIKRLVSVPGTAAVCTNKQPRKSDNNHSIKELLERNKNHKISQRMIKLTRHSSVDMSENGTGFSLLQDYAASSSSPLMENLQRRKLVIFNGRNGQITKVFKPDHHHRHPTQPNRKASYKDKLHSSCLTRSEIGSPTKHIVNLPRTANQKVQKRKPLSSGKKIPAAEPVPSLVHSSSGRFFQRSRSVGSQEGYPPKPINV